MEDFKLELFKEEYGRDFPSFTSLSQTECKGIREIICEKFGLSEGADLLSFAKEISHKQIHVPEFDATDNFELTQCLDRLGISFDQDILLNWYQFDEIDRIKIEDVNQYFDDIWFPDSDDIDLFDKSLDWILSIRHDGEISVITAS